MAVSRGKTRKKTSKQPAPKAPIKEPAKTTKVKKENGPSFWSRFSQRPERRLESHSEFDNPASLRWIPVLTGLLGLLLLFTVYQLGRAETNCSRNYVSMIGTVKNLPVMVPKNDMNSSLFSFVPSIAGIRKSSELKKEERVILVDPQGNAITVIHDTSINLQSNDNKNVILTGDYSPCKKSITLDSTQNVLPLFANQPQTSPQQVVPTGVPEQ